MARPGSPPPPVPSRCNGRRQPTMAVLWLGPRRGWQGDDRARHWDVCCKGKNMTRLLECHGFIWIYQWKNRMVCFFRMFFFPQRISGLSWLWFDELTNFGSGDWKSQGEFTIGKCAFSMWRLWRWTWRYRVFMDTNQDGVSDQEIYPGPDETCEALWRLWLLNFGVS